MRTVLLFVGHFTCPTDVYPLFYGSCVYSTVSAIRCEQPSLLVASTLMKTIPIPVQKRPMKSGLRVSSPMVHGQRPKALDPVPFDPSLPEDGALIVAEVLRDQFNALQSEITQRVTQEAFDANNVLLNQAIAERPTVAEVNEKVYQGIDSAVATVLPQTSSNTNAVSTFDEAATADYDQAQFQRFIDKVNELINGLRR